MAKPRRRRYTDADRATALAALQANDGNISRTARETGVSTSTLRGWRDNPDPNLAELRDQKKQALGELWDQVARTYIARALDPAVLRDTNGQAAITAAAIATDKHQLLSGRPTEINRYEHERTEVPERALEAAATALKRRGLLN